jgi:hypothetical protein
MTWTTWRRCSATPKVMRYYLHPKSREEASA